MLALQQETKELVDKIQAEATMKASIAERKMREVAQKQQELDSIIAQRVSYEIKTKVDQVLKKEKRILARRKRKLKYDKSDFEDFKKKWIMILSAISVVIALIFGGYGIHLHQLQKVRAKKTVTEKVEKKTSINTKKAPSTKTDISKDPKIAMSSSKSNSVSEKKKTYGELNKEVYQLFDDASPTKALEVRKDAAQRYEIMKKEIDQAYKKGWISWSELQRLDVYMLLTKDYFRNSPI